jgi:hypothetical protein
MEARRRVEFTSAKLTGGTELAAPLEKATAGLVEKASRSAVERKVGGRHDGEGGWEARRTTVVVLP